MSQLTLAVVAGDWMAEVFAPGYLTGRRGVVDDAPASSNLRQAV